MKYKLQAKNVITRLANGLKTNKVKELLLRDKSLWNEREHSYIPHFIAPSGDIDTQVQRLEELKATIKGAGGF